MKERVEQVRQQRETAARGRDRRLWPTVGIVGYTNAGKSTLLNALVGSEVAKAEDKLFATLDPTSRQVKLGDGQTAIVTDTVGFIHKLPHQLVDAFRATLEEVNRADVLVEVVDASDAHFEEHRSTVQTVLDELGAGDKPRLLAFNKADLLDATARDAGTPAPAIAGRVFVSALTGYGMDTLRAEIAALLASMWVDVDVCLPYAAGRAPGTRPRARHDRARVRRARGPRRRARLAAAGRRAGSGRESLGRRLARGDRGDDRRRIMTAPTRVAGWGSGPDGTVVTWTVAEGRKGRRWREVVARGEDVVHALLLETDTERRFSHLELARTDGLWTFHPESNGTLHGNHVAATGGVRHVVGRPFAPDDALLIEGSPISLAAIAWRHAMDGDDATPVAGVVIGADGALVERPEIRIERLSATRWQVGEGSPIEIDDVGLPVLDGG